MNTVICKQTPEQQTVSAAYPSTVQVESKLNWAQVHEVVLSKSTIEMAMSVFKL